VHINRRMSNRAASYHAYSIHYMINKNEFNDLLLNLKKQVEERIDKTHEHIHHSGEPVSKSFDEQAAGRGNDEVVYTLDSLARTELADIEDAIKRIENNEYGICNKCGVEIEMERLKTIPYTRTCKSCASD